MISKYFISRQFTSKIPLVYNKKGARIAVYEAPSNISSEEANAYINKEHDNFMILTKIAYHPTVQNPTIANRILETVNPGEFRRIEKREDRRRKDRAIVRDFCKKILYIHEKQIPK